MNSKVTIAVPVYGVEKFIERCARSLFGQTYPEIEYLFVDDCTPDNSIIILKKVLEDFPDRKGHVRIIRHERNRGLGAARNTAVDNCHTEFIVHVDSDDYIDEDLIEKLIIEQRKNNGDIVMCGCKEEYGNKTIVWDEIHETNTSRLCIDILKMNAQHSIWGKLIRRSLYEKNHLKVKEGVNNTEDLQILPILMYYAGSVSFVNDTYYHYNCMNLNSYTAVPNVNASNQSWETFHILESFFSGKGKEYEEALQIGKLKNIAMQMARWAKFPRNKEFYIGLLKRLEKSDKRFYSEIPLKYRMILYIKKRWAVAFCERIAYLFKKPSI